MLFRLKFLPVPLENGCCSDFFSSCSVWERMLFRLSAHAGAMMIELVSHQKAAGTLALIQYL
jgi:hypothetical protein